MSFYMILSSNVDSLKVFGVANKISNFKTKLGRNINLNGEWVVGLAGISYTKSWYNVFNDHQISLFDEMGHVYQQTNDINTEHFKITRGYYDSPQKLVNEINKILKKFTTIKPLQLLYNEINNCVVIEAGKVEKAIKIYPFLGNEIENILGLRSRNLNTMMYTTTAQNENSLVEYLFRGKDIYRQNIFEAFHPVEISGGYHCTFVPLQRYRVSLIGWRQFRSNIACYRNTSKI